MVYKLLPRGMINLLTCEAIIANQDWRRWGLLWSEAELDVKTCGPTSLLYPVTIITTTISHVTLVTLSSKSKEILMEKEKRSFFLFLFLTKQMKLSV